MPLFCNNIIVIDNDPDHSFKSSDLIKISNQKKKKNVNSSWTWDTNIGWTRIKTTVNANTVTKTVGRPKKN